MRTFLFFVLYCLSFLSVVIGQTPDKPRGERPSLKLVGQVLDAETNLGLEYATVTVYSKIDSSIVGGALTGPDGLFEAEIKGRRLYAQVEFLSFEKKIIDPIPFDRDQLRAQNMTIDMGIINLNKSNLDIDEVTISGQRSETQFSLDKRVFNVGSDLANRGGTAEDILDNVPSVAVDIDGGVSLRGSGGVRILINGKPSNIASADNANSLRNIQADMIESIEVITNPSSRYEAEGSAGIINIILKKQKRIGFNGSFDGSLTYPLPQFETDGFPLGGGLGINVNYRLGKINWFAGVGLNYRVSPGGGFVNQEIYKGDSIEYSNQNRIMNRNSLSQNYRVGMDYFFSEKTSLTGSINYRLSKDDKLTTIDYLDTNNYNSLSTSSIRTDDEVENETGLQYNVNFRKEFSSREHVLNVTVQYEDDLESESSKFNETSSAFVTDLLQRSMNDEGEQNWIFQGDYTQTLGSKDHKYEVGLRTSIREIGNDYLVESFDEDVWIPIEGLSNEFIYHENIYAAYGQYGNKFGKFSAQIGLRAEYGVINSELITTGEKNKIDTLNLFPSAYLNYEISEGNGFQVNYSRRIRRPRFFDLNPFFTYSDNRNFFSGNPRLSPEYTDSYELNYIRIFDKGNFTTGLFYRHTEDVIERVQYSNGDGTFFTRPENLSTRDDVGLELNGSYNGIKWLRLQGEVNFFRSITNGENVSTNLLADAYTARGRLTARFSFWDSDLQLRGNFRGPRVTTQGRNKGITSIDLGWSKELLKSKNLTLTFSVKDLLNSRKRVYTTEGIDFFREGEFQWRSRSVSLNANYRLNQKKSRRNPGGFNGEREEGGF